MNRLALTAAATLVVVVSGALLLPRLVNLPPGNQSPSPTTEASTPPAEAPTAPPVSLEPPRSATLVAFQVRIFNGSGRETIWVQSMDGSVSRDLMPDSPGSWLLGRTSDGSQLLVALFDQRATLALVDIQTGEPKPVPADCPSDPCWADFQSPFGASGQVTLADDRTAIAVLRDESNGHQVIATIDLATGQTEVVEGSRGIFVGAPGINYPTLSRDGTKVAYVVGNSNPLACASSDAGMVLVVDRLGDASSQRQLAPFKACAQEPRWSPTGDELLYTTAEVTRIQTGTPPPGGTTSIAVDHHDVFRVTLGGSIERLTTGGVSSYGAWTRDGRISFVVCDPNCDEPGLEVWILDPETGERSPVDGTPAALGEAGCIQCPFVWINDEPAFNRLVVGVWPEAGNGQ